MFGAESKTGDRGVNTVDIPPFVPKLRECDITNNPTRVLYIISTTMAALAHDRYTTFLRSEVYAQRCSHYTPPTTTFRREPIPPKPISAALGISEDIAPEVPQKAARRMSSWIPEESDTPRVFGEKQEEGTRRVLSVRNV